MNGQLYLIPKKYFIPRTLSANEFLEAQKTTAAARTGSDLTTKNAVESASEAPSDSG